MADNENQTPDEEAQVDETTPADDTGDAPAESPDSAPDPADDNPPEGDSPGESEAETPPEPESPGETEPETPPPPPEPDPDPEPGPESAPDADPEPEKAAPAVDIARRSRQPSARQRKQAADKERHDAAIEAAPRPEADPEAVAEEERKEAIQAKLAEEDAIIREAEETIAAARERTKELLAELYPSLEASDRHVDACRAYIESEKKLRANRALAPARLEAMLKQAGKAPIDAAFSAQRARGMRRPTRTPVQPPSGDGNGNAAASE